MFPRCGYGFSTICFKESTNHGSSRHRWPCNCPYVAWLEGVPPHRPIVCSQHRPVQVGNVSESKNRVTQTGGATHSPDPPPGSYAPKMCNAFLKLLFMLFLSFFVLPFETTGSVTEEGGHRRIEIQTRIWIGVYVHCCIRCVPAPCHTVEGLIIAS